LLASLTQTQCLQALAYIQGLITREDAPARAAGTSGPRLSQTGQAGQGFLEVSEPDLPAEQDWRPFYVPIIDNIAAGAGTDTLQAEQFPPGWAESFVAFPDAPEGAFAVRVRGDSMAPRYHDGDLIIVDPARQGRSGEPAVVVYQDPSTGARLSRLKRLRLGSDRAVLESLHPDYPPVELTGEDLIAAYGVYRHLPRRPDASSSDSNDPLGSLRRMVQRHRWQSSRDDSQSA
jgi:phage repressor protein C with HTH and peptisase S24 domain